MSAPEAMATLFGVGSAIGVEDVVATSVAVGVSVLITFDGLGPSSDSGTDLKKTITSGANFVKLGTHFHISDIGSVFTSRGKRKIKCLK